MPSLPSLGYNIQYQLPKPAEALSGSDTGTEELSHRSPSCCLGCNAPAFPHCGIPWFCSSPSNVVTLPYLSTLSFHYRCCCIYDGVMSWVTHCELKICKMHLIFLTH
jgi:hypothetical protein